MKTKNKISGYVLRTAVAGILCSSILAGVTLALNYSNGSATSSWRLLLPGRVAKVSTQNRTLSFADRVAYQRAIEEVYWQHRIWPNERRDPKPSLDAVMSQAQIEKKVHDYLRDSRALEDYWQEPITPEQLQTEMERMAQHTKQPEVLRELFHALGDDPFVIAECLARPVLVQRLITELNDNNRVSLTKIAWPTTTLQPKKVAAIDSTPKAFGTQMNRPYQLPAISTPLGVCIDDTWAATSTTNGPSARADHTAVWTGSEMIVWGGWNGSTFFNVGGRYDPSTDSWTPTSTTNAPSGRADHTAVWTGSEMIVWGGVVGLGILSNTGGRYDPITDSWTATSTTNPPSARVYHTAVWTGSEMIVWGGQDPSFNYLNTGGRYDPSTNSWTASSITNAPTARAHHTAVWTDSEMIVWGGAVSGGNTNSGGRYDPSTDSWTATSLTNAPTARSLHTAVWTSSEMIVWGGSGALNTGGRYDASIDSWTATSATNAPTGRAYHTAVWTGTEMIVWGGLGSDYFNTGGRYDATTDSWTATSTTNAPSAREIHTAVWTGSEMIVWGGIHAPFPTYLATGGRYCAQSGATPTPTPTATATATATPTATATATTTATPTSSPTPTARPTPTPRSRPTPAPRP